MQTIFLPQLHSTTPRFIAGQWRVASAALENNLKTVVDHFHNRSLAIKGGHLLTKILNSVGLNYTDDLDRFYSIVDSKAKPVASVFKLTTDTSAGTSFDGTFYGEGMTEFVIAANEPFEPSDALLNWKVQTPVKIVSHPKTDIECHVPNGISYSSETGVAVIAVNIPLLFVMYRGFVAEQIANLSKNIQAKTTAQFILTYVLPNAIESHLNIALFNRCLQKLTGAPSRQQTARKHPFQLMNITSHVDGALNQVLGYLTRNEMTIEEMLLVIPAIKSKTAADSLALPQVNPTFQYAWVEVVARLPDLVKLMLASKSSLKAFNKDHLQHVSRLVALDGLRAFINRQLPSKQSQVYMEMLAAVSAAARAS